MAADRCREPTRPAHSLVALFAGLYISSSVGRMVLNLDKRPALQSVLLALHKRVPKRIRNPAEDRLARLRWVQRVRADERRRIAREVHDRLGEVLAVGLRQLDLCEVAGSPQPDEQSRIAREALVEAMRRLRLVTSGLRDDPVTSLEKALLDYIGRVCPDVSVQLSMTGDEAWAPDTVLDEAYLVIREALRNALAHARAKAVVVSLDVTACRLYALVEDDGRGIAGSGEPGAPPDGVGLATMRERAALLGGELRVTGKPGHGTSVELIVALPGNRRDQPR